MNLAQLDKVAEIIGKLGDKTIDGLIAYLGFNFAIEIIGYSVGVTVIIITYKLLKPIANMATLTGESVTCLKRLREVLSVGSSGALTSSEITGIYRRVVELVNAADR